MTLSISSKFKKAVIYVEIYKIFSVIEIIKTAVCIFNSKVNHSISVMDLLDFESLLKMERLLKMYVKFK